MGPTRTLYRTALVDFLVFLLCFAVQATPILAQQATPVFGLKVKTDEGNGASTTVKSPSTEPPVVLVTDASGRPIQGAIVVFTSPESGASGVFEDGSHAMTAATDRDGRAAAIGYRANGLRAPTRFRYMWSSSPKPSIPRSITPTLPAPRVQKN
jgi:hypothetical protein